MVQTMVNLTDYENRVLNILNPDIGRFPADKALRKSGYDKLRSPVNMLWKKVEEWYDSWAPPMKEMTQLLSITDLGLVRADEGEV